MEEIKEQEILEGLVEEIIYYNEENAYMVCEISDEDKLTTVVGFLPYVNMGDLLKLHGEYVYHRDYGNQFKVSYFEKLPPKTETAIIKYLSSGIIKGIGEKTAQRIVEAFGSETLDIISNNPMELSTIRGISYKKALAIQESYLLQMGMRNIIMFLQQYNITPSIAIKIYKTYGERAISVLKENPYLLCDEVYSIGFKTADRIALSMGISVNYKERICAGAIYILNQHALMGHTYIPEEKLVADCKSLLSVAEEDVFCAIDNLVFEGKTVKEETGGGPVYYSAFYYNAELGVARRLWQLSVYPLSQKIKNTEALIKNSEKEIGITLAKTQKEAVKLVLGENVSIITGGPGTGKTTIINTIIRLFESEGLKILLAAPTGRAAKRMSQVCGMEAKTIHRLLEIGYSEGETRQVFHKNEESPLLCDVLIVDEMSMVDILLMNSLLKAVRPGTRLVMVGDSDQLPSVGAGNVLRDMISCGKIPCIALTDIFRQAEESMIVVNAHRINNGEYPKLNEKDRDFFFLQRGNVAETVETVIDLCKNRIPKGYGLSSVSDIQVLCPMRKTEAGVLNLNERLQAVLNPPSKEKAEKRLRNFILREGDKVMQIKNNYDMQYKTAGGEEGFGVFNGDCGIIREIDNGRETITVEYDDEKIVEYDFSQLQELELSYAVTIHKSQGSEFPVVIMPVTGGPPMLLTRNLFYTAVTRAKQLVILVGSENVMRRMIDNNRETKRNSRLPNKIKFFTEDNLI